MTTLRALPREVYVLFLIDFLNSYRSFGFRTVQYMYCLNEIGLSDVETGNMLGINAWLLVVFGMLGAMLVDSWGVRRTALCALGVAFVSRGILTFARSREWLLFAMLGLSPFGEAVLSTGVHGPPTATSRCIVTVAVVPHACQHAIAVCSPSSMLGASQVYIRLP